MMVVRIICCRSVLVREPRMGECIPTTTSGGVSTEKIEILSEAASKCIKVRALKDKDDREKREAKQVMSQNFNGINCKMFGFGM